MGMMTDVKEWSEACPYLSLQSLGLYFPFKHLCVAEYPYLGMGKHTYFWSVIHPKGYRSVFKRSFRPWFVEVKLQI